MMEGIDFNHFIDEAFLLAALVVKGWVARLLARRED